MSLYRGVSLSTGIGLPLPFPVAECELSCACAVSRSAVSRLESHRINCEDVSGTSVTCIATLNVVRVLCTRRMK
jgi:hypothetical protein